MEEHENVVKKNVFGPWATTGLGLAVGITYFVIQILIMIVFVIAEYKSNPKLDLQQLTIEIGQNGSFVSVAVIASAIVCTGLIFLIIRLKKGAVISEYLGFIPVTGKTLLILAALTAGFIILSDSLHFLLGKPVVPQDQVVAFRTCDFIALLWISIVITAPVFEEIFVRGFLLEGFRQSRIGNTGAIVLTSFVWSILHFQYGAFDLAIIFIGGILLGIARIKTGSIWSCVFIHALNNFVSTIETVIVL